LNTYIIFSAFARPGEIGLVNIRRHDKRFH